MPAHALFLSGHGSRDMIATVPELHPARTDCARRDWLTSSADMLPVIDFAGSPLTAFFSFGLPESYRDTAWIIQPDKSSIWPTASVPLEITGMGACAKTGAQNEKGKKEMWGLPAHAVCPTFAFSPN